MSNFRRGLVAISVAASLLVAAGAWGAETEQRCDELGSQCICSEPLSTFHPATWKRNPISNQKACPAGIDSDNVNEGVPTFAWVDPGSYGIGLPSGNDTPYVLRVLQAPSRVGNDAFLGKTSRGESWPMTNGTFCARSYKRWHPSIGLPNELAGDRTRVHGLNANVPNGGGGSFTLIQHQLQHGNLQLRLESFSNDVVGKLVPNTFPNGQVLTLPDCQGSWCRFEMCLDFDANSNFIRARSKAVVISGSRPEATGSLSSNQAGRSQLVIDDSLLTFYNPRAGGSVANEQYISHFMMSQISPMNGNFWIGCSEEVEGSCSGNILPPPNPPPGPAPPPPAGPPSAPILLEE